MANLSASNPEIILASSSPRRRDLLTSLGVSFQVISPPVDEEEFDLQHLDPADQVLFLSDIKAKSVATQHPDCLVIGCDTLVAVEGQVLGKPKSPEEAEKMLFLLQNNVHQVHSGITVIHQHRLNQKALTTRVWMKPLSPRQILHYIATGEPMDKAGSYAIQGQGSLLVEKIDGCYFNVVGMSLYLLNQLVEELGFSLNP